MKSASFALVLLSALLLGRAPLRAQDAGGVTRSTEVIYQEACDSGDLIACNVFGLMYETGDRVPQDPTRAVALYERACEGGEMVGCTNLGLMYEAGLAVERDSLRAKGLYEVACEGGELLGCSRLGPRGPRAGPTERRYAKTGRVGDGINNLPLSETLIEVPALDIRVVTDVRGRFELTDLPVGTHKLLAERVGYERIEGELIVPGDEDFVVLLLPLEQNDPYALARIVGRVTEVGGGDLSDVEVRVVGRENQGTLTNQQGRFTLRNVDPGLTVVRFSRLGYAPRTAMVIAQAEQTVELQATMAIEPIELEAIEVSVRSRLLEQGGFYDRAERGLGSYIRPAELEALGPVLLSDAFRMRSIPGIRLMQDPVAHVTRVVSRRASAFNSGECVMPVYLDGVPMREANIDLFQSNAIEAVEVYHGIETPPQYLSQGQLCGAIVLWSRRGA